MAVHVVKVPDVGEGIAEVELVSWAVTVGHSVKRNEIVAEVMTDKATVEVPAPHDGVINQLHGAVGDILAVGSSLFALDSEAAASGVPEQPISEQSVSQQPGSSEQSPVDPIQVEVAPISNSGWQQSGTEVGDRPKASPALRKRARDAGIDLNLVTGTGPNGRITHDDLDRHVDKSAPQSGSVAASQSGSGVTEQPIVGIRRKISERMVESVSTIPHITYVEEVDVTSLERLRATLNERTQLNQPKLTLLPFIVKALTRELPKHHNMNAHVDDDAGVLRMFEAIHVGIATQTENGLVVPVLHNAQANTIWTTAAKLATLAETTKAGRANPSELSGSTITITSLGKLGGIVTTPVINKPEVAIIGINKIAVRPVWENEQFVPRKMMNLSASFDHRVIDGWDAAVFIQAIKAQLEQPALLFVDD